MDYSLKSTDELEKLIRQNDMEAVCELAERFLYGKNGCAVNYNRAYQLLHKAEKHEYQKALILLGDMYKQGIFFAQSDDVAKEYYEKAGYLNITPQMPSRSDFFEKNEKAENIDNRGKNNLDSCMRKIQQASTSRQNNNPKEAIRIATEVIKELSNISNNQEAEKMKTECYWIIGFSAFNLQEYGLMEQNLKKPGVYDEYPWAAYLIALIHDTLNANDNICSFDMRELMRLKDSPKLSQKERADMYCMLGELCLKGVEGSDKDNISQAQGFYSFAANLGNGYAREQLKRFKKLFGKIVFK